eukprot:Skav231176  [mRNA]  locus=scaffold425:6924:10987:+ [translate_table: standard]
MYSAVVLQEVFMCKDIDAAIIKKAFAAAGTIVFPSDMQRHLYDGMFRPDAGHTIYNGASAKTCVGSMGAGSYRICDEDFLVLHLGTVCSRKGQVFSATACAKLIKARGGEWWVGWMGGWVGWLVGGSGPERHLLPTMGGARRGRTGTAADYHHGHPGCASAAQAVLRFYMAADVVLVASLNEVLPLVICESMAFERPVVCSKIDAIPEALTDGVEGYLVPPGGFSASNGALNDPPCF